MSLPIYTSKAIRRIAFYLRGPRPPFVEGVYHPAYKVNGQPWYYIPITETVGSSVLLGIDHECDATGGTWERLPDNVKVLKK